MHSTPAEYYPQMVAARVKEIENMGEVVTVLDSSSLDACSKMSIGYINERTPADIHCLIHEHIRAYSTSKATMRYSIVQGNLATIALLRFLPGQIIN